MSDLKEFFMTKAIEQARLGWELYNEVPVGAVVVHKEKIVSVGHNLSLTNLDPTAHAEVIAIRKAATVINNYRLPEFDIYVTLEPCPMCLGAIINARIKNLIFGAKDPKFGALGGVVNLSNYNWNHKFFYQGGILEHDCVMLMKKFFQNKR
jgi:tRNA(adenine34) deaminase